MKILKVVLTIIIVSVLFLTNNITYASMADYTDEDAEKETQKLIQEHKENFDSNKSDNNFLKDLSVAEGYLSPNFDRQIINYSLKIENNIKEINITANAEDSGAKVNGTGIIDINNISEHKIEVIAPSGTIRTYFIKIVKSNEESNKAKNEIKDEVNENEIEENIIIGSNPIIEEISGHEHEIEKNNKLKKLAIVVVIIIIAFIGLFIIIKVKNKKSKH